MQPLIKKPKNLGCRGSLTMHGWRGDLLEAPGLILHALK